MLKNCLLIVLFIISANTYAQRTFYFKKGLLVNGVHHYGREAIYTDSLAYRLYSGTLKKPVENDVFSVNATGDSLTWKTVSTDSNNVFRTRGFGRGGYLYLTYNAPKQEVALLNVKGNSAVYVNGVLHAGDPYASGWLYIPVTLKKGLNELYVRTYYQTTVSIVYPEKAVAINTADSTFPHVVLQKQNGQLKGAIVVINASANDLKNYKLKSLVSNKEMITGLPVVPAMSTRKMIFDFDAAGISQMGKFESGLVLLDDKNKQVDEKKIIIEAVDSTKQYSSTFISDIDGSLQYYSVTPQAGGEKENEALFLSVHGAAVEAISQARAYHSKDWGTLVAATNRRPRGFNWEDWGRLDALEVLDIAKKRFKPNADHIYLTGHSMGGHGTWFLGATYPGNWAGIAPCSGYPTLKEYGSADGKIPDSSTNKIEQLLLRSGNQSDVLKLVNNYKPLGIYILHGDSDRVVPVTYARQMKKALAQFHADFSYYEYPGGGHWFGDQSVDWNPLFSFFKWHSRLPDSAVNHIDFTTSSPGISATYRWATVMQQQHPLQYSRIQLERNTKAANIAGSTQNVMTLALALDQFTANSNVTITLDSLNTITYTTKTNNDTIYLANNDKSWSVINKPSSNEKTPQRYGTFKEAFNHNMVFVYGTNGTKEENEANYNKAKFDAESWYYRGNGAVDIITDKAFSEDKFKGRNIIIYGNATNNTAWNKLLQNAPIQVTKNSIKAGSETFTGDDLATYFVWPQNDDKCSIGVVAATGVKGMQASLANQYFAGGSGFPDYMIFTLDMLNKGAEGIKLAGFFDNKWQLSDSETAK